MAKHVVTTAQMRCTMGSAPAQFIATPKNVKSSNQDAANIMDHVPLVNILPFGQCRSLGFPATASATAAAQGALTPMPCIPNTPSPWSPGATTVLEAMFPALNDTSCLTCAWGGMISFSQPGEQTENIP